MTFLRLMVGINLERVKKVMRKYMMWSDRVVVVRVKAVGNVRVVEVVKALEKEFRTILRRTISLVLFAFPLFPSYTRLILVNLKPCPTTMGSKTFLPSPIRVLMKLTLAAPELPTPRVMYANHKGVVIIPIKFPITAFVTAVATLPLQLVVRAMHMFTVVGNADSRSRPVM